MAELTNVQRLEVDRQVKAAKEELEKSYQNYDKLEAMTGFNKNIISILHRSVAKNTSISELAYFLSYAKGIGLNPLNKEIWCYKNNRDDVLIFTGRDGFLKKNKENPLYRGMRSSEVCENDTFSLDMIEGKIEHKITNGERGKPIGAYAIVSIEGQRDTIKWLDFDEYNLKQAKWNTAPKMMIKKCAESAALKEAAGMTGIQSEESFAIKDNIAYSMDDMKKETVKEDKEAERLELLIKNAKTIEDLKKFVGHCNTPDLIELYDNRKKELELTP